MMISEFPQVGDTINDYTFDDILYSLDSRKIYLATRYDSISQPQKVVIKVISIENDDIQCINNETNLLLEINSPFVLNAIEIFDSNGFRFLVTPRISDGDSLAFAGKCDELFVKCIIYDVLKGLNYLHEMNIWHRDIKPENIFIKLNDDQNKPVTAVVGDLGFAKKFDYQENQSDEYIGTLPFCSPQIIANHPCMFSTK
ncbi:AGC family protein kinase [Tritrichomonas foetus]|uniref:AGC family protein kinase n=1 Tax=Tritrichomonas foetus TaxID=1144522 RepID=A0A1J4J6T8_9EUKA|nr:AGC family protein kinase [Tritrichomonas foetus]|eukprot:OHS93371.1 AGC family protein kinase [Tritrichomonas foetus]